MPIQEQYKFYTCQKCRNLVEKVYQNGYCASCLQNHFSALRGLIDNSHALCNYQKKDFKKDSS